MFNLATGERQCQVHSQEQKSVTRIKQLRVAVWCGIEGLVAAQQQGKGRFIMFTLTYKGVLDWGPRSIRSFGRWLTRHGSAGYVWVAELQKRGAVHYHVLAIWPNGQPWSKPNASNGGWTKGFTWVTDNVRRPYYLMKYIQKGTKDGRIIKYPKGIRIYAVSRGAVGFMRDEVRNTFRSIHLPSWFREGALVSGHIAGYRRVRGGIAVGSFVYLSPYAARVPVFTEGAVADLWYNVHSVPILAQE